MPDNEHLQNYITELRRGSLVLAVLASMKKPYYGYSLLQALQKLGTDIEANTLYPLLRRLEGQGLLSSNWDTTESRPRKYYSISEKGTEILTALLSEWDRMRELMDLIREGRDENE